MCGEVIGEGQGHFRHDRVANGNSIPGFIACEEEERIDAILFSKGVLSALEFGLIN